MADVLHAPAGLGETMASYFDVRILVSTGAGGASAGLHLASAMADGEAQQRCTPTSTVSLDGLKPDGSFTATGMTLVLVAEDEAFRLQETTISGRLDPGGLTVSGVVGAVDTAELVGLLGASEPTAMCDLMGANLPCGPCPDGERDTCWQVELGGAVLESSDAMVVVQDWEAVCGRADCAAAPACLGLAP